MQINKCVTHTLGYTTKATYTRNAWPIHIHAIVFKNFDDGYSFDKASQAIRVMRCSHTCTQHLASCTRVVRVCACVAHELSKRYGFMARHVISRKSHIVL